MVRKFLSTTIVVGLATLAACASPSLRYTGLVTAAPEDSRFRDSPTKRVALKDRVTVVTHVASLDGSGKAGQHAVRWNWYEGQTLIAEQTKTLDFAKTPYRFSRSLAASDLGVGHYRVEVMVDGVSVDEQAFEVVAN